MHHRPYFQPWTCCETVTVAIVNYITVTVTTLKYLYNMMYVNNSALLKVSEVNGSGPTALSFGSYYGPPQSNGKVII